MIGQKIPQDILSLSVCDVTSKVMLDLDSTCEVINDDLMTYNWEFNNSFSPNGLKQQQQQQQQQNKAIHLIQ